MHVEHGTTLSHLTLREAQGRQLRGARCVVLGGMSLDRYWAIRTTSPGFFDRRREVQGQFWGWTRMARAVSKIGRYGGLRSTR
jgi:hypothetical protein